MTVDPSAARRYARLRYRVLLADLSLSFLLLAFFQLSGLSTSVAAWWVQRLPHPAAALLGYLAVYGTLYYLVRLPLHVYGSFIVERRFGLSRMRWPQWWAREAKQVGLSAILVAALIEGLYALLREAPQAWPVWAAAGWVVVSVVLARIFPTVLLPMFYKTVPLEETALAQRLRTLCQRAHVAILGVFRVDLGVDTRKANAALAGLGRSRRVLVSDTLLAHFTPEEIETVLAHELGHHRHRHLVTLLALSGVGSLLAFGLIHVGAGWRVEQFGLRDVSDPAGFPALMLSLWIIGLIGLPLQNAISRAFEWQADRFAVAHATHPSAFASALRKLGDLNLADPNPPRWVEILFYDHPALPKRIAAAEVAAVSPQPSTGNDVASLGV